jgi:large subunit ribosomal protein L29
MPHASEIRAMDNKEILAAIEDAKNELLNLRFQRAQGQLADINRIRSVKQDIARYKTILRERQIATELVKQEEE